MLVLLTAILATMVAVLPVLWLSRRRTDYSHVRQTISELGEAGSRDEKNAAIFAFAPAGHALWLFIVALAFAVPELTQGTGLWLFAMLGAGYIGAAIFPCDPGAPLWGTWRNNLHNLLAGLGYVVAAGGMMELGRVMEDIAALALAADVARVAGPLAVLGIFALSFPSALRGLVQRLVEAIYYSWMLLVGVLLVIAR